MSIESRYELGPRLWAEGGVEAYVALDTDSGEPVSAFLFPRARTAAPHALTAFQQLGRRLSGLSHPSLLEVLSIGVEDGLGYVIAADIEGTPFARLLERADGPSLGALLETVPALLEGLALGHAAGFHHGRLGAERVYLSDGQAVLVGLGLSQLERALEYGAYQLDLGNDDRVARDRAALAALSGALVVSGAARPSSPAARPSKPPVIAPLNPPVRGASVAPAQHATPIASAPPPAPYAAAPAAPYAAASAAPYAAAPHAVAPYAVAPAAPYAAPIASAPPSAPHAPAPAAPYRAAPYAVAPAAPYAAPMPPAPPAAPYAPAPQPAAAAAPISPRIAPAPARPAPARPAVPIGVAAPRASSARPAKASAPISPAPVPPAAPRTAPPPPRGMPKVQRAPIGAGRFPQDFEDEITGYGQRGIAVPSAPWSMSAQILAICSVTLAMAILILTTA